VSGEWTDTVMITVKSGGSSRRAGADSGRQTDRGVETVTDRQSDTMTPCAPTSICGVWISDSGAPDSFR
jgi:hypothetical protein